MTVPQRRVVAALTVFALFAVALQVAIAVGHVPATPAAIGAVLANTFSYFTILTNSLVAVLFGAAAARGGFDRPACSPGALTAVTGYIVMVGTVYEALLRERWSPIDLGLLSDFALHDAVPVFTLLVWAWAVPKGTLTFRAPLAWLAYPLLYVLYTLLRGAATGWYPYFFIDVARLGYRAALVNTAGLLVLFLLVGIVMVATDRTLARRNPRERAPGD